MQIASKSRSLTPEIILISQQSPRQSPQQSPQQSQQSPQYFRLPEILNDDEQVSGRIPLQQKIDDQVNIASSSLIGPFKNDLEICLFLVQRPDLINLALNMMKASGQQESTVIQGKSNKFNVLSDKVNIL